MILAALFDSTVEKRRREKWCLKSTCLYVRMHTAVHTVAHGDMHDLMEAQKIYIVLHDCCWLPVFSHNDMDISSGNDAEQTRGS